MSLPKGPYRDVYYLLQKLRNFLIGRAPYLRHNRYNPLLAPRTLPKPDIPRGPEYKYSNQYYFRRSALHSVNPPVVAPVALGDSKKKRTAGSSETVTCGAPKSHIDFPVIPTPGLAYWWDGHMYYECVPDFKPRPSQPRKEIPPDIPSHIRQAKRAKDTTGPCAPNKPK